MSKTESITTLGGLIAAAPANAVALAAPERSNLEYTGLNEQVRAVGSVLAGCGIGAGDSVAIVLPNGPDAASAFLGVATHAGAAPLNPAYRSDEVDFYLGDLDAKALIVAAGSDTPALAIARQRGIAVIEITPQETAGRFTMATVAAGDASKKNARAPGGEDTALFLHTSGTTSRPKLVPLSHRNLIASARNIRTVLSLTADDRCLNIMPLFHIHGLVGVLTTSVGAGASVYCPPGYNALKFFGWLTDSRATWYSAVPTMHQANLARADRNREALEAQSLRFVRSSSSSLPARVMKELEDTFGCPVIESYGMTEAAHQMTSNPLPPAMRKPGSVGIPAGPEVRLMAEDGSFASRGETGEVVIRGPNVTAGYVNNPRANEEAFRDGWFRTGDLGRIDSDGYLTIEGRLKEIINRGGEKISPREIDEALMAHPAVAQAVAFALPHDKLGEDVGAAVVLREGASADERSLREFLADRLADFKVPRRILLLDAIPKGATGKLQRIGLAKKLGLAP
jgi:acyl-CoA synthetase (AMP-forming)/AMP-acid ligase II